MKKSRFIKIKDPYCKTADDIRDNYSGLWRYLKLERVSRRDDNGTNYTRGYMLWTKKNVFKVEPRGS